MLTSTIQQSSEWICSTLYQTLLPLIFYLTVPVVKQNCKRGKMTQSRRRARWNNRFFLFIFHAGCCPILWLTHITDMVSSAADNASLYICVCLYTLYMSKDTSEQIILQLMLVLMDGWFVSHSRSQSSSWCTRLLLLYCRDKCRGGSSTEICLSCQTRSEEQVKTGFA